MIFIPRLYDPLRARTNQPTTTYKSQTRVKDDPASVGVTRGQYDNNPSCY